MRQFRWAAVAATVAVLFAAAQVAAQGEAAPVKGEIDAVKEAVAKIVDINAMVATTYNYGFNRPASDTLNYEVINKANNTFAIYDAFLQFSRNHEDEDFGFNINMDFGETAKYTGSDWNGNGAVAAPGDNTEEGNAFELREAYGTYKVPWDGVKLKAGKFVTLLGYEVLMTNTAFNPNISHSILFGYAIPFTHVGVLLDLPMGELAWADIGIVNGWDNAVDNNNAKTLIAGLGIKPLADLATFYLAGTYGSETNGQAKTCSGIPCPGAGAGAKRGVVTLNGTVTPIEGLSFIVDSVYGNESNILPDPITGDPNSAAASWYGLVGYVTWAPGFDPVPGFQFALRAEVFDDVDGARNPTGTVNPAVIGTPQTVEEVTGTISYVFSPNIVTRLEYRYDHSDKFAYEKDLADSYSKTANTITAELILAF